MRTDAAGLAFALAAMAPGALVTHWLGLVPRNAMEFAIGATMFAAGWAGSVLYRAAKG